MAYIKNLSALKDDELITEEKMQAFITLKILRYIYSKHNGGERNNYFEKYYHDAGTTFKNPPINENRIKTLLNEFDTNFDHYKGLQCFKVLAGEDFQNTDDKMPFHYFNNKEEKRSFDLLRYIKLVSKEDGKLKPVVELERIRPEEIEDLRNGLNHLRDISEGHTIRLGGGLSR